MYMKNRLEINTINNIENTVGSSLENLIDSVLNEFSIQLKNISIAKIGSGKCRLLQYQILENCSNFQLLELYDENEENSQKHLRIYTNPSPTKIDTYFLASQNSLDRHARFENHQINNISDNLQSKDILLIKELLSLVSINIGIDWFIQNFESLAYIIRPTSRVLNTVKFIKVNQDLFQANLYINQIDNSKNNLFFILLTPINNNQQRYLISNDEVYIKNQNRLDWIEIS